MIENARKSFLTKRTALIVAGVLLAIFLFGRNDVTKPAATPANSSATDTASTEEVVELGAHGIGEGKTGVMLMEYGDFQSVASGAYQPMMQQVMDKYGDQLKFVYRDFPVQSNAASMAAQRAANAADEQSMFWQMRTLLYERQATWKDNPTPESIFEGYAKELGMDMERYKQVVGSKAAGNAITADIQAGQKQQVTASPTLFINDKLVPANIDLAGLTKLIDEAIASNYQPAS